MRLKPLIPQVPKHLQKKHRMHVRPKRWNRNSKEPVLYVKVEQSSSPQTQPAPNTQNPRILITPPSSNFQKAAAKTAKKDDSDYQFIPVKPTFGKNEKPITQQSQQEPHHTSNSTQKEELSSLHTILNKYFDTVPFDLMQKLVNDFTGCVRRYMAQSKTSVELFNEKVGIYGLSCVR